MKYLFIKRFIKYLMIYFNIFFMIFIKDGKDYDVFKKKYLYLIFMFFFGKY